MTSPEQSDMLTLAELAAQVASVTTREGEHYARFSTQIADLVRQVAALQSELAQQRDALAALDALAGQVTELAAAAAAEPVDDDGEDDEERKPYKPAPTIQWWKLAGAERAEAVAGLRDWVRDVFAAGYGHLAAQLPACWQQHDLCCYALDTIREYWCLLHLGPRTKATLAGQAELQTLVIPRYLEQMRAEARNCGHGTTLAGRP